jgi:beta-glucanase (GH16 family)
MRQTRLLFTVALAIAVIAGTSACTPQQMQRFCQRRWSPPCVQVGVAKPAGYTSGSSTKPVGVSGNWKLVWNDEFNGTAVNTQHWTRSWFGDANGYSHPVNSLEDQCFHAGQATVSGGWLHLAMERNSNGNCETRSGATAPYKSGVISSNGKYSVKYGYLEAQIDSAGANGDMSNWAQWWTDGQHWPQDGEIDIMESLTGGQPCAHVHTEDGAQGGCSSMNGTGVHTYGVEWTPAGQRFFYDGHVIGTLRIPIDSPHYLVLAYGHNAKNPVHVPSEMKVNYVRVWKPA